MHQSVYLCMYTLYIQRYRHTQTTVTLRVKTLSRAKSLKEWSSVIEEKMTHFDHVADRSKGAVCNVEKKEAMEKHEKNIIQ